MDIKGKVTSALTKAFRDAHVRLEGNGEITGFVVSPSFGNVSSLERQTLIDDALSQATPRLSSGERSNVLMIAGLTPVEYDALGARIRVHQVRERADGTLEITLRGGMSDAEYVRGALQNQKGVETTVPKQVPGAVGVLMSFEAKGKRADPLTKSRAIRVLKEDPYIEVVKST